MIAKYAPSSMQFALHYWATAKVELKQSLPIDVDWLHLALGPVIFLAAALVMRKQLSSWAPWIAVLMLAMMNEFIDLSVDVWPERGLQYSESATDLLLTMALPTLLLLGARCLSAVR